MTPPLSPAKARRARRARAVLALPTVVALALLLAGDPGTAAPARRRASETGSARSAHDGRPASAPGQQGRLSAADQSLDWPQWRGPLGNGVAPRSDAPLRFAAGDGVAWKVSIPGRGNSSPVVFGDHVFVTTAIPVGDTERIRDRPRRRRPRRIEQEFRVIAIDRRDGSVAWSRAATVTTPHEGYHRTLSSYANASPVTDGERVYAFFGSRGLYAYDLEGELLWSRDFGVQMQTFGQFGEASSPALHGDTLVVVFDHQGESFIEAIDTATGATRWRAARDENTSWSSPYVVAQGGRPLVVASGAKNVVAYDLQTGEVAWRAPGVTPYPVPTPVAGGGLLFATSGSTERKVFAIELGGARGKPAGRVAWRLDKAAPYNPSPLLWDEELYLVRDGGLNAGTSRLSLIDASSGEPVYLQERLPRAYSIKASPVGAAGRIYLATEEGDVLVIRRGPDLEVLATNPLDEPFIASPAVAHDTLFLRSTSSLFALPAQR